MQKPTMTPKSHLFPECLLLISLKPESRIVRTYSTMMIPLMSKKTSILFLTTYFHIWASFELGDSIVWIDIMFLGRTGKAKYHCWWSQCLKIRNLNLLQNFRADLLSSHILIFSQILWWYVHKHCFHFQISCKNLSDCQFVHIKLFCYHSDAHMLISSHKCPHL